MDIREKKPEDLIDALKAAESNLNEGRPPTRHVVAQLMQRADEEDLD